jgi:glycosyltransferase involved in cell wall biosynthesis
VRVDLLAMKLEGGHAARIPEGVNVIPLKARHSLTSIGEIAEYLKRAKPDALLVAKDRAGRAALRAKSRARSDVPVFIRLGTNLSAALEKKSAFNRWLRIAPMRRAYKNVTGVIAVSDGVKDDTEKVTGLERRRIHVIRNPVITPRLDELASEDAPHEWLHRKPLPVIIGMGRLTRQKGFDVLVRAFAEIQNGTPSRLILLGEGQDRQDLLELAQQLRVSERFLLAGFQRNPYAWLARADLFVLSSAWEGSPNALTEALALGVPSVSTDCPSGPNEILARGRYGPLVPVGDSERLANAMRITLRTPKPAPILREAVAEYRSDLSAKRYLALMGLLDGSNG